jgi:hypothetical protein
MSDAERLLVATEGEFQEAMLCVVGYKASEMSVMMHQPLDKVGTASCVCDGCLWACG